MKCNFEDKGYVDYPMAVNLRVLLNLLKQGVWPEGNLCGSICMEIKLREYSPSH